MTGFAPQVASYHGTKLVFTELLRGPLSFTNVVKKTVCMHCTHVKRIGSPEWNVATISFMQIKANGGEGNI